jgi:hypothetical protein
MNEYTKNSQKFFFISTILSKYKRENCNYTKEGLIYLYNKTLRHKKNKYETLITDIIYNIEYIDNVIQDCLYDDIAKYEYAFVNIIRCMVGQMIYDKKSNQSLKYNQLRKIKKEYRAYINGVYPISTKSTINKRYQDVLTAVFFNVFLTHKATFYEKIYFTIKHKVKSLVKYFVGKKIIVDN